MPAKMVANVIRTHATKSTQSCGGCVVKAVLCLRIAATRAVASPTQLGGRKKIQVGPNICHLFLKFEVKNRCKSAGTSKSIITLFCCLLLLCYFQRNKIFLSLETYFQQIYISKWDAGVWGDSPAAGG